MTGILLSGAYSNSPMYLQIQETEMDDLIERIRLIVEKESYFISAYWKCCFCLCPRINPLRVIASSQSLKTELIEVFRNSLNSHVYRNSPLAVCLSGADGFLIDCNESYLSLMQCSKEELGDRHSIFEIKDFDFSESKKKIFPTDNGVEIEQFEVRIKRKDGTFAWSQVSQSKIFNPNREIAYVVTQISDISDVKECCIGLENKIEASNKIIRDQEVFVRHLMTTNNHEMRTTIGGVVGCAKILREDRDTLTTSDQNDLLFSISSSSERLLKILNDNLDFFKLSEGKVLISKEKFSLSDLLRAFEVSSLTGLGKYKVDLSFSLGENIPAVLIGDMARMRQVLESFLSNALNFIPNGRITVDVTFKYVDLELDRKSFLFFKITNSGDPIEPTLLTPLFNLDEEGVHSRKDARFDLVMTKGLVELMGGEVFPVISPLDENGGVIYSFSIKVQQVEPSLAQEVDVETSECISRSQESFLIEAKKRLKGKKILVADDSVLNQKMIRRLLTREGLVCSIYDNGKLAVEALKQNPCFDLVLMDVQMPVMDGLQATSEIRQVLGMDRLPIIGLTANGHLYSEICLQGGMNAYSEKPYNEKALFLKMDELISQNEIVKIASGV